MTCKYQCFIIYRIVSLSPNLSWYPAPAQSVPSVLLGLLYFCPYSQKHLLLISFLSPSTIPFRSPPFLLPLHNYSFSVGPQISLPRSSSNAGPPGGNSCKELLFTSCSHKPREVSIKTLYKHEASVHFSDALNAGSPCSSVAHADWLNVIRTFTLDMLHMRKPYFSNFRFLFQSMETLEHLKTYAVFNFSLT